MNSESTFHILAVVFLLAAMSISIYHRRKASLTGEKISEIEEGKWILNLRRVIGLVLWFSALAYLINPSWMKWSSAPLPDWTRWLGAVLMALCIPFIYWVFSSLGKNVTPTVVTRQNHTLVTYGPYRWVRHPLYTVGFTAFVGLSLLSANWFILAVLLLGLPVIMARTPLEEARLIERFGDEYTRYMQITGRYLPRFSVRV